MPVPASATIAKQQPLEQLVEEVVVRLLTRLIKCEVCHGKGRIRVRMPGRGSWDRTVCVVCRGRGVAVVRRMEPAIPTARQ